MTAKDALRAHLVKLLDWRDAHVGFEDVVQGIPEGMRGVRPEGSPYSAWQLLEHLRLAQRDILDFCRDPSYEEGKWPDDYWPHDPEPPAETAWNESIAAYRQDREALKAMAADVRLDLSAAIPHGHGQTLLRELLLVADHNAYHVGQLVLLRRLLGLWK